MLTLKPDSVLNKRLFKLLQIVATFTLLGVVFYQAGLFSDSGQQRFLATLKNASLNLLVLSVLVGVLINLVSALKWHMLVRSQALGAGYWRIFAYYLVGQFYNMFLPTSVGGDVVRAYELGKFSGRQADSLASVFVERYTGVLTLLVVAAAAVLSQLSRFNQGFVVFSLVAFALGLGLIGWLVFDKRPYRWLRQVMVDMLPVTLKVFSKLDKLVDALDDYRTQPRVVMTAFVNSILFYFIAALNVYVTALVFNADVRFLDMLIATPIIMLLMNIPLSFGNIGLMEFAYTSIFTIVGYGAELGVAVALLMRLKSLFDGAMGGVMHPIFVTQKY